MDGNAMDGKWRGGRMMEEGIGKRIEGGLWDGRDGIVGMILDGDGCGRDLVVCLMAEKWRGLVVVGDVVFLRIGC
jgi:hypothetical protein